MANVLEMQDDDGDDVPEALGEQKQSSVSYVLCRNSRTSQVFCIRW